MAITKKQMELDQVKWIGSEQAGTDLCGTYDYCAKCDKTKENPCAKAHTAFNKKPATRTCKAKKK